jgi:glycerol-3-phosphate acyltransferase PlsY
VRALVGLVVAYGLGALPWGLWLGRWFGGVDVRTLGSGNPGATNVYRTLGPKIGLAVFVLDFLKGVAGVFACRAIAGDSVPGGAIAAGLGGALAAVLGHVWSVFAGFKGGKGVATGAGAMVAVAPLAGALGLVTFAVALFASRRVSVGSIVAALVFALALWTIPGIPRATAGVGSAVAALVLVRHVPNMKRLARGEEPAFELRRRTEPKA